MKHISLFVIGIVIVGLFTAFVTSQRAGTDQGVVIDYAGQLQKRDSTPLTTPHDFRFSLWTSANHFMRDTLADGALNTAAPYFSGWLEEQTVTPDSAGAFLVEIGQVTALSLAYMQTQTYLQVEVKERGAPLSTYQIIDPSKSVSMIDRMRIGALHFSATQSSLQNILPFARSIGIVALIVVAAFGVELYVRPRMRR